jgi:hypothetical protein
MSVPPENEDSGEKRNRQVAPILDSPWRCRTDQQVASDASGVARCKRQDQNSEHVQPLPDSSDSATDSKDKRTDEIKYQQ